MKRGRCDVAPEDIMLDTRDVDPRAMHDLAKMYRECTFVRAASRKLHAVALNGGLCAKIGGMIDLPYFEGRTGEQIRDNMARALQWIDAYGFIPFTVDTPASCTETSGAPIGFGSDEADMLLQGGQPTPVVTDAGEVEQEPQTPLRAPALSVEPSDFDFTVPSLGVGHYKVYRDATDNKRRVVYADDDADRAGKRQRKGRAGGEDKVAADEDDVAAEPVWYVYTVEEPSEDGDISSRMARLQPRRRLLESYESVELSAARMGARPPLVTQAMTPGKGLRNLDHHTGYMTDAEAVTISTKDSQGMPSGFRDALRERDDWVRNVLEYHGIDADNGIREAVGTDGQMAYSSRIPIESRRQLATVLKPTRTIDVSEKQREYVQRVAVEFGVPPSDLTEMNARYKPERGHGAVSLIENGRALRHTLTDLLYHVFELRNARRFHSRVKDRMRANVEHMRDLQAVIAKTKRMIEEARHAALGDGVSSEPAPDQGADNDDKGGKGGSPPASAHAENAGLSMAPGCDYPEARTTTTTNGESDVAHTPQSVRDLVAWVGQIEMSYAHIGRVQAALDRMLKRDRPIDITWKQPLVADSTALEHTARELRLDDAQRASLARFYYGLQI